MGYCLNRLDESVLIAVSKPLLTEFGIHHRLESCGGINSLLKQTEVKNELVARSDVFTESTSPHSPPTFLQVLRGGHFIISFKSLFTR